jgi:hypothetical protein
VTRVAVAATRRSGRSDSPTKTLPMIPVNSRAPPKTVSVAISTFRSVASTSASGSPVMSTSWSWPGIAVSR